MKLPIKKHSSDMVSRQKKSGNTMICFSTFLKGLRLKRIEFLRRVGGQLADYENGSGSAI